jgi:hypothetical protein
LISQAHVLPTVKRAQLLGFLNGLVVTPPEELNEKDKDGKDVNIPNPAHGQWISQEQFVPSYLLTNMMREVLTQMAGLTGVVATRGS